MLRHQGDRFRNVAQFAGTIRAQPVDVCLRAHRHFDHGTFAGREVKGQPHDFERQQQVREDNGGINAQDFRRGDGHLCRQRGLLAYFQKGMLLAHGPVLGHIAPGLPHEPYRRPFHRLRSASAHKNAIGGRHELLTVAFLGGNVLRPRICVYARLAGEKGTARCLRVRRKTESAASRGP